MEKIIERSDKIKSVFTSTGSGALAVTLSFGGKAANITQILLHTDAAGGSGNFTVTLDSHAGAAYDTQLDSTDMTTVTNVANYQKYQFFAGDSAVFAWANAGEKTWGLTVVWEAL